MSKLLKILGAVAPTVATAFGWPMIGLATHTLGKILLGKDDATEDELTEFILSHQNPEVLAQIKKAEVEFKQRIAELEIDLAEIGYKTERMHVDDRISARTMAAPTKARAQAVITAGVLIAFAVTVLVLFLVEIPEGAQPIIYVLIGTLASVMTQVMNFWFGSSSGSKEKSQQMGDAFKLASAMSARARASEVQVEAERVEAVEVSARG